MISGADIPNILLLSVMALLGLVMRNFDKTMSMQNEATRELSKAVQELQLVVAKEYLPLSQHVEFRTYIELQHDEIHNKISETRERLVRVEAIIPSLRKGPL